jgi:hypothetical protein
VDPAQMDTPVPLAVRHLNFTVAPLKQHPALVE